MGDFTATGDTFIGSMIEMAGGINVAKDSTKWQYSIEKLVEKNPDIIICSKYFNTKKGDRKSTRLNSSHANISYAVFCLKKKKIPNGNATTSPVKNEFWASLTVFI